MTKFAKRFLWTEGVILVGILLSAAIDPSFMLFGMILGGSLLSITGIMVTVNWRQDLKGSGQDVGPARRAMVWNIVLLIGIVAFSLLIFSGDVFSMV